MFSQCPSPTLKKSRFQVPIYRLCFHAQEIQSVNIIIIIIIVIIIIHVIITIILILRKCQVSTKVFVGLIHFFHYNQMWDTH